MPITIPSGRTIALAAKSGGGFWSQGLVSAPPSGGGRLPYQIPLTGADDKNIFYPVGVVSGAYFVDGDSGSDANDGIRIEDGGTGPWATIEKATATLAAGDTCYVRKSVTPYRFTGTMLGSTQTVGYRFANNGTAGNYIRLIGYPGEMPVIDQGDQTPGIHLEGNSYIQLLNLEITNIFGSSVNLDSGLGENSNIVIAFCELHKIRGGSGTNVAGIRFDRSTNCTIRENKIYDARLDDGAGTYVLNENACPMVSYEAVNCLIENNEMYDAKRAMYFKLPDRNSRDFGVIRNNVFHDVEGAIKFNCNPLRNEGEGFRKVYIYSNIAYSPLGVGYAPGFIMDTNHDSPARSFDFFVFNNTTNGYSHQFRGSQDVRWVNNVLLGSDDVLFGTEYQPQDLTDTARWYPTILDMDYNFWGNSGGPWYRLERYSGDERNYYSIDAMQASVSDGNVSILDTSPAENDLSGDALLVDVANQGYRPSSESPLIDSGMGGITRGAYITGDEQIGVSW